MLRYWGNIGKYYTASKASGFTIEECYSWLVEALSYALKMRKWRDPNHPLSKDPNAPDKVINRCIYSRRQYYYYLANCDKRRANYASLSLDDTENVPSDHNEYLVDDSPAQDDFHLNISTLSASLYRDNRWFDGLLLNLLEDDSFYTYSKVRDRWELNTQALCTNLKQLSYEEFEAIFKTMSLDTEEESIRKKYDEIEGLRNSKLKALVNKTLGGWRTDEKLKVSLC